MIKSWATIAIITLIIALGANLTSSEDKKWFKQLRRPKWLTFEPLIPVIWTIIFICGGISADQVWQAEQGSPRGWLMMALYVLLEIVIVAYVPVTLRSRNPRLGTWVGLAGFGLGLSLTLAVAPISSLAAGLLVPYLIWSLIGSYVTWAIARLNP